MGKTKSKARRIKSKVKRLWCEECKKSFLHKQRGNVLKRFCDPCVRLRNAKAKVRYREGYRALKDTPEEEALAAEKLSKIPDREVSMSRVLELIAREAG